MRQSILGLAFALFFAMTGPGLAGNVTLEQAMAEKSIGRADAPVTMVEYASLTCSHCAAFNTETLPKIEKDYINTGKVRLVYHDFPLDPLAMVAAMIARCAGDKNYFAMLGDLFASQKSWMNSNKPGEALTGIARLNGMSEQEVNACTANKKLFAAIKKVAKQAETDLDIQSTTTFFIAGTKIPGNVPYKEFQAVLDKALAAKQ